MRLRRDRDGGGEDKIEWEETGKVATKTRQGIALVPRSWHQNSSNSEDRCSQRISTQFKLMISA